MTSVASLGDTITASPGEEEGETGRWEVEKRMEGGGKRGEARYGIWVIYKSGMRLDTAVKHTATAAVLTGGRCQLDA